MSSDTNPEPTPPPLPSSPPSGRQQNEVRLLIQYDEQVESLKNELVEADPHSSKGIQRQLEQKMKIYWQQIQLVQTQFPNAVEGKIAEASYYTLEGRILLFSSGMMRRTASGGGHMAFRIGAGIIAKAQESANATKALASFDKALRVIDNADSRLAKAAVYAGQGQKQQALDELNYIIANFPDDEVYVSARQAKDEIENPPKKSGCFVATAAYGSPLAQEVIILTRFRDEVLLRSRPGLLFVAFYYRVSPPLASLIARFGSLRAATRTLFLAPLLRIVKSSKLLTLENSSNQTQQETTKHYDL